MLRFSRLLAIATVALALALEAQVPQLINYQGRVAVGTTNFNGAGQFKFALVNGAGTVLHWSNNGTNIGSGEANAAVPLTVTNGLYSVLLGDATLANMTVIPNTVFNSGDVWLRVWFDGGTGSFQRLTPDQRIAAVGYAMMAANAAVAQTVPDGAITAAKIAPGAVGAAQIAEGAVGSGQILDGSVGTSDLTANAVTASKLGSDVGLWSVSGGNVFRSSGSIGVGTSAPGAVLQLESNVQFAERLRLSGTEFYQNGVTDTQGIAFLLGTNRPGNRQLWIADSARTSVPSSTNPVLRIWPGAGIDAISTDASTQLDFGLGGGLGSGFVVMIKADRNVGINNPSPATALDVTGTVTATTFSGSGAGLTNVTAADNSITTAKIVNAAVTIEKLASSAVTVSAGAGLAGGGVVSLGGSVTLSNAGVTSLSGGGGITVSGGTGAVTLGSNATSGNTGSTLVLRDASGNFSAGTITANLIGNVTGSAASFTGTLAGDVTGTQAATAVASVGGVTAANVAGGANLANAATNANTANTIVRRDGSGNFIAGTIAANLSGNATTATTAATVPDGSISNAKLDAALALSFAKFNPAPLEFVTVGNLTNLNDTIDGNNETGGNQFLGAVATQFQMGKYEVTNEQYAEFLNAVAMTDANGLYDPSMGNSANAGIIREGYPGKYAYVTKTGMRFKPAVFVKWHSAIRFCNWLTNSKPTGAQGNGTTETGAYTITGSGPNWSVAARTVGAPKYYLPTENEWYKAAYHKNNGNNNNYWLLPTNSSTLPNGGGSNFLMSIGTLYNTGITVNSLVNSANFRYSDGNSTNQFNDGYAVTGSDLLDTTAVYVTDAGLYTLSPSAYGTFDQGGNVSEWTETGGINTNTRVVRGGAWDSLYDTGNPTLLALRANIRSSVLQSSAQNNVGFRVTFRP